MKSHEVRSLYTGTTDPIWIAVVALDGGDFAPVPGVPRFATRPEAEREAEMLDNEENGK